MQVRQLDHVNLRTTRLEAMIDWYSRVLGLQNGFRPRFAFPGAWLYAGDSPVVHLVGVDGECGVGSESPLRLEHFAFSATGGAGFEATLRSLDVRFRRVDIPELGVYQINLYDPDGNHIHVDFPMEE